MSNYDIADENSEESGFDVGKRNRTESFDPFNDQEFSSNNSRHRQHRQRQQTGETPPPGDPSGDPRNIYGQPDDDDKDDDRPRVRHMRIDMKIVNEGRTMKLNNAYLTDLQFLDQIFSKFANISYQELALIYHPTAIYKVDSKTGVQEPKYFAVNHMYRLLTEYRALPENIEVINAVLIDDIYRSTDETRVVNSVLKKILTEPEYDPISRMYKTRAAALIKRDQENLVKLRMTVEEKELKQKERKAVLQTIRDFKQEMANIFQRRKADDNRLYNIKGKLKDMETKLKDLNKLLD